MPQRQGQDETQDPGESAAAASGSDFVEPVRDWGQGVVAAYLDTRGRTDMARSVKSLVEETTGEYGGRFFLELLQNAHDAHDECSTDGQVLMLVDESKGEHGVVYVADSGRGFDYESFRAISNLALSNKAVGEGIGNKGVGFKSVLQVCESPEIYSCDPADRGRDGFCFGFADDADLARMAPDPDDLRAVRDDVSRYTVPVPIVSVPEPVRALRDEGFSTVLRLPLRSAIAAKEVSRRFDELGTSAVPVVLFLTRIEALRLERSVGGDVSRATLRRVVQPLAITGRSVLPPAGRPRDPASSVPIAEIVTIDGIQRFLMLSREIDRGELRAALETAVAAEQLKERWLNWEAAAHVAVAVPLDRDIDDCRLYTYLPMDAECQSPLHGHLHAPFFTDFARRGMVWDHPLNSMLLDSAAKLALDGGAMLLSGSVSAPATDPARPAVEPGIAAAAVDLVSWSTFRIEHVLRAAPRQPMLPVAGGGAAPLVDVWQWPEGVRDVLTLDLASAASGLTYLEAGLGEERLKRLADTANALGQAIALSPAMLAEAVEAMAMQCLEELLPIEQWDLLYNDLAYLFGSTAAARKLSGRRILLTDDLTLQPCWESPEVPPGASAYGQVNGQGELAVDGGGAKASARRLSSPRRRRKTGAAPFFPPVRQITEDEDEVDPDVDLEPPASLRHRIFFLHAGLTWHDENRQPTKARKMLQDNRLVRRFDARSLVEHVRSVLSATTSERIHRDAVRFLFNLQRGRLSTTLALEGSAARLPTVGGGLASASEVLFSREWPPAREAPTCRRW